MLNTANDIKARLIIDPDTETISKERRDEKNIFIINFIQFLDGCPIGYVGRIGLDIIEI